MSNGSEISSIYTVARNEFNLIKDHPFVIIISVLLFIVVILNSAGGSSYLGIAQAESGFDVFFRYGIGQIFYTMSMLCTIVAMSLGVISIARERSRTLNVLMAKPLYLRDIVIGKFIGIGTFLLLFITATVLGCTFFIMLFYRAPESWLDFVIRVPSFILIMFLECALCTGITMLFGIFIKNLVSAVGATITLFYIEWFTDLARYLGGLFVLSPKILYFNIFSVHQSVDLLVTTIPYVDWLTAAAPYIVFIVLEIIVVLALDCIAFARSD